MSDPIVTVAWALIRAAVGLFVAGVALWGLKKIQLALQDLRQNWGRWDTYPWPDERAMRNVRVLFSYVAAFLFGMGALLLYISWVLGWLPWHA